ncbi:MAG: sigma 54-interacting transcriptional regulator [bacterium]
MYKLYIINDREGNKKTEIIIYSVCGLIASFLIVCVSLIFSTAFTNWECVTFDWRMKCRGELTLHSRLIPITIDRESIEHFGDVPWDLSVHAEMIEKLSFRKAHTIVYNNIFQPGPHEENDDLLIEATMKAKNVYYPVNFDFKTSPLRAFRSEEKVPLEQLAPYGLGKFVGDKKNILSVERAKAPFDSLCEESAGLGHICLISDDDGVIRKVPLIVEMNEMLFPSLSLRVVMNYLNVSNEQMDIRIGKSITLKGAHMPGKATIQDIVIPIDDKGMMLINYDGEWDRCSPHYNSFKEIFEEDTLYLKDTIVMVNTVISEYDIKSTPFSENFPVGGIHINCINTILTENFLKEANSFITLAFIVVLAIIGALSGLLNKWSVKIITSLCLLVVYLMVNFYFFSMWGLIIEVIPPCLALILSCMLASLLPVFIGGSEKKVPVMNEHPKIKKELIEVNKKIMEKEKEITITLAGLSNQRQHIAHLPLKEKLRGEMEEKENLEKKKVMILRQLSPLDIKILRKEAEKYGIITKNLRLLDAFDLARKIALTDHTILLIGEEGSEKELFAGAIHAVSNRKNAPFVKINFASLSADQSESELFGDTQSASSEADEEKEGLFKKADKGTFFLDNIDALAYYIQPKLLKILQEGEIGMLENMSAIYINVRVIAATGGNLEEMVHNGEFNALLLKRLNSFPIFIPPLRERMEDIPHLVDFFIDRHKGDKEIRAISKEAVEILQKHTWPGNVDELEKVIINAIKTTHNEEIQLEDIQINSRKIRKRRKSKKLAPELTT